METNDKKLQFYKSCMCHTYKTATFWNKLELDVITEEIPENPQTVGEWLRHHRVLNNYTKTELSEKLNMYRKTIENIEYNHQLPSRKNSKKLAEFFKLGTTYFYDDFYENSIEISNILKKHRNANNYTLREIKEVYGIRSSSWNDWELGKREINKETYERLKKLGIL